VAGGIADSSGTGPGGLLDGADPPGDRGARRTGSTLLRLLRPGIGIKRWLVMILLGELAIAVAGAFALKQVYRNLSLEGTLQDIVAVLTLQFLPYWARAIPLVLGGIVLFVVGVVRLVRAMLAPFGVRSEPLVEVIYQKRFLARGPRIVAIGGGTGLSALLRGIKEYSSNITAVVTVADDGGSSGKLRAELGIAPMGDIRNCIAALADAEPLMTRLLQYRFPDDSPGEPGLAGHTVGNLVIAAMTAIEGDFEEGVRQSNRVLAVRGQVVPAAPVPLTLHARLRDGTQIDGQSAIARSSGIERVWVTPGDVRACEEALQAIATADIVVLGPGSLYTSLLPSLLMPDLRQALAATHALRVYVCNVATQVGETEGYGLADHLAAIDAHASLGIVDVVLANDNLTARISEGDLGVPVRLDWQPAGSNPPALVRRDVVDQSNAHRHDSPKLGAAVMAIHQERLQFGRPMPVVRSA
jgi:uncharacterized cofD-like protein